MTEWLPELVKQGGFAAIAAVALWFAALVFKEYLKLNAILIEIAKGDAVSDTNLLNAMTRLIAAVQEANAERRRGDR